MDLYSDNAKITGFNDTTSWHHIVGTYDGTNQKLYLDGVLGDTEPDVWNNHAGTNHLIGAASGASGSPSFFWNGSIDEVMFWDSELTAAQINSLHKRGDGVYYWKVNSTFTNSNISSLIWQFESDTITPVLTIGVSNFIVCFWKVS